MADQVKTYMTAQEFLELPETNLPVQLLNGEVVAMTAPELDHQDVVGNIFVLFKQIAKTLGGKAYVAPVDVYFDELNVPQPDVVWVAPDSKCQAEGTKRLKGAPDLIAEVLSPSTARLDKRVKFRLYEKYGVREHWIVDPRDQLIEVWQHKGGHFVLLDAYGRDETFNSALIGAVETNAIFVG
jgi:Uma2 family endonuclease